MFQKTKLISSKRFDIYVFPYLQTSTSFVFFNGFLEEWWTPICNLALFTTFSKGDNNVFTLYYLLFCCNLMTNNCEGTQISDWQSLTFITRKHMCYSWRKTWSQQGTRATPVEKLGKTRQGGFHKNNVLWTNRLKFP